MTENKTYQVNPDLRVSYDGERVVIVAAASTYSLSDGKLWPFIAEVLSTTEELSVPEANGDYSPGDIDRLRSAFDILAQTEILIPCGENVWPDVVVSLANRSGRLVPCEDIAKRLENANILVVDPHHSSSVSRLAAELRHYPIAEPTIVHKVPKNVSADLMVIVAADEHDPVLYEATILPSVPISAFGRRLHQPVEENSGSVRGSTRINPLALSVFGSEREVCNASRYWLVLSE